MPYILVHGRATKCNTLILTLTRARIPFHLKSKWKLRCVWFRFILFIYCSTYLFILLFCSKVVLSPALSCSLSMHTISFCRIYSMLIGVVYVSAAVAATFKSMWLSLWCIMYEVVYTRCFICSYIYLQHFVYACSVHVVCINCTISMAISSCCVFVASATKSHTHTLKHKHTQRMI